jgi:glycosyltransferase involved in cell wall biosynthesis
MAASGEGKSLNVVFIHPSANPRTGGIVKAGLSYIRGLRAHGHTVEVWTSSPVVAAEAGTLVSGVVFDAAFESWIKVLASPKLRGAARAARRRGVNAFLHNTGHLWPITPLLGAERQYVVFHNEKIGGRGFFRNWLAISSAQRDRLEREAARRPWVRSVRAIRNGLSAEVPQPPETEARTRGSLRVGVLGEMRAEKGLGVLIEAAARMRAARLAFTLVVGGDGPEMTKLKEQAKAGGLSDVIEWRGWIEDVDVFYRDIDVFCLPSQAEPFGLVVLEAMMRGVPVVATRTDGPRDLIRHGETGWLVPVGDASALAAALSETLADMVARTRVGRAARSFAVENYSDEAVGAVLEAALLEPVAARAAAPSG